MLQVSFLKKVHFSSWRIEGKRIKCNVRFPGNWSELQISWAVYGEDNQLIGDYNFDSSPSDDDAGNPLTFGAKVTLSEQFMYSQVNQCSLWSETMSAQIETDLYNGGAGLEIY